MVTVTNEQTSLELLPQIIEHEKFSTLYQLQKAYITRAKITFSVVLICWHPTTTKQLDDTAEAYEDIYQYVSKQVRDSDAVFHHIDQQFVVILLSFSGTTEASHFLQRIFKEAPNYFHSMNISYEPQFLATICEVANSLHEVTDVMQTSEYYLKALTSQLPNTILTIDDFSTLEEESVKVSIIENNPISKSILKNLVTQLKIPNFSISVQTFEDGYEFLQSNWYKSGHTHIVLVNDILPRKNGIEVMNKLRSLPNEKKYIIILMSKRDTEEALIYAYDNGADAYFKRPFNLHLIETQIKNILRRLR